MAQLVYDVTVRFCDRYVDRRSRTHDQMVQAARSGVQNIAEGSQALATSKKTELKLTQVARVSLEELKLDYEDYLRHRGLPELEADHSALMRFKELRCQSLADVQAWVAAERKGNMDKHGRTRTGRDSRKGNEILACPSVSAGEDTCPSLSAACLVANGAFFLLNLACYLLGRQVERLAADFENEGGFTERLYRARSTMLKNKSR